MPSRFRASVPVTDDWAHFDFAIADGVATVTLNRPEKLNPLTFESYADLRDLLAELPHHTDVRVLVIRGEGKGFCGGGDVNEIIGELIKMEPRDLFLFTKVGLSGGDMGAAYLLPRVVGLGRATELLMLGGVIDAATADRYGLVSRLVGDDEIGGAVAELARTLADGPTLALAQTKALLTRELDMPLGAAMELDAMTQALLMTTKDHAEFHAAFNEKRPPRWQ